MATYYLLRLVYYILSVEDIVIKKTVVEDRLNACPYYRVKCFIKNSRREHEKALAPVWFMKGQERGLRY